MVNINDRRNKGEKENSLETRKESFISIVKKCCKVQCRYCQEASEKKDKTELKNIHGQFFHYQDETFHDLVLRPCNANLLRVEFGIGTDPIE